MPEIFTSGKKFKVVEYGKCCEQQFSMMIVMQKCAAAFKNFFQK